MPRGRTVQRFKDESLNLEARIIEAVGTAGPRNVAQISRMTGVHQETIRYKMNQRFVRKGFRFQANVDYLRLGLRLHWGVLAVSPPHSDAATRFFRPLSKFAYLVHFAKIMPQGHFEALFALPEGKTAEFAALLASLKRHGIVSEFSLDSVSAHRHKSMDPTFYSFRRDRWEVDWDRVSGLKAVPLAPMRHQSGVHVDGTDVLIVKELQKDARQPVVGMGRKLKIPAKTLEYHYRTHVVGESLVSGYRVRWMKDTDQPLSRTTAPIRVAFRGLDREQYERVQSTMNRLPYLWSEDRLESGTYIATLAPPLSDVVPTMSYMNREMGFLGEQVEVGFLSAEESYNYTIPYEMFSRDGWQFDAKKMEHGVLRELAVGLEK